MPKLMISYSWGYKKNVVDDLYKYLTARDFNVWKDDEGGLQGHVVDGMAEAVENSEIIVVCLSENYVNSKNCKKELEYADELGKTLIVVKLDPIMNLTGHGAFSMILAKQLYIQDDDQNALFGRVVERIQQLTGSASIPSTPKPLSKPVARNETIVWGVGIEQKATYFGRFQNENQIGEWQKVDGAFAHISVGPMGVFGVTPQGQIAYRTMTRHEANTTGGSWQILTGSLKQISSGKDHVFGVNDQNDIFMLRDGGDESDGTIKFGSWLQQPGKLNHVALSTASSACWGIVNGRIFYCPTVGATPENIDGVGRIVEAGGLGVFGISHEGAIFYRIGTNEDPASKGTSWQNVPGKPTLQISVGRTSLFMVATDGTVQTMINMKWNSTPFGRNLQGDWKTVPGLASQLSICDL